ncbi:MAG: hypothetical protein M9962_09100 [Oligoflexia bacterium]|nr:hypothetical protein [Oligoflexia bacterium]
MEAIALFFSKFSEELISLQLALVFFASSLSIYWLLIRKKKKESAEWVSAALVRAYLDRVRSEERDIRIKLFGEDSFSGAQAPVYSAPVASASGVAATTVVDPSLQREVDALRAQLSMADQRSMEYDRLMNGLKAEKSDLEKKLADAAKNGGSVGANPEQQAELDDLREKLKEYEVIEDDLANLKKFKKENEDLRQQVEKLGGKAEVSTVQVANIAGEAKDQAVTKIENVTEKIVEPVTVVSGASAAKSTDSNMIVSGGQASAEAVKSQPTVEAPTPKEAAPVAEAPKLEAVAKPTGEESNTNVLQEIDPSAETSAAKPEESGKSKEEELLSEFEKMLAS